MEGEAYDDFLIRINFVDPYKLAEAISKPQPAEGEEGYGFLNAARDAPMFDIGQGTGLMGKLLKKEGFTNIDGADASSEFVRIAQESGWYQDVREFWFARGVDQLPNEWKGRYDIVVASGVFLEGHIPAAGFDDAHALCKTGGYFITSIRKQYWENGHEFGYKDKIDELVSAGKFELVKTWTFMRGVADSEDPLFVEMPSFMFVCKRLD